MAVFCFEFLTQQILRFKMKLNVLVEIETRLFPKDHKSQTLCLSGYQCLRVGEGKRLPNRNGDIMSSGPP